jgi:hypothetical protein
MNILIGLAIFLGVAFVIAVIEYIRGERELSVGDWFLWYLSNVGKGTLTAITSFMGRMVPTARKEGSDAVYATIEYAELHAAIEHAHSIMGSTGWTLKDYLPRALDCEDFAMKMKVEATKFLADNCGQPNKGIPIHLFGYTREDGKGHVLIYGYADGKRWYFEVYPEAKYLEPKELTLAEIASCDLDFV